jgi:hypothetical protein
VDGPANFLVRDHVDDFNDVKVNLEDSYDEIAITTWGHPLKGLVN